MAFVLGKRKCPLKHGLVVEECPQSCYLLLLRGAEEHMASSTRRIVEIPEIKRVLSHPLGRIYQHQQVFVLDNWNVSFLENH